MKLCRIFRKISQNLSILVTNGKVEISKRVIAMGFVVVLINLRTGSYSPQKQNKNTHFFHHEKPRFELDFGRVRLRGLILYSKYMIVVLQHPSCSLRTESCSGITIVIFANLVWWDT